MHYDESLEKIQQEFQKAFKQVNDAWEKRFGEIEAEFGLKLDRPSADKLNRCSVIEVPVQRKTFAAPCDDVIEEDSFAEAQQESIEISDDEDSETSAEQSNSLDPFDEPPPEKRNRSSNE